MSITNKKKLQYIKLNIKNREKNFDYKTFNDFAEFFL